MGVSLALQLDPDSLVPGPESGTVVIVTFLVAAFVATVVLFFLVARLARFGYRHAEPVTVWLDQYLPVPVPTGMWGRTLVVLLAAAVVGSAVYFGLVGAVGVIRSGGEGLPVGGGPQAVDALALEGDAVELTANNTSDRSIQDADGDRLPDAWERAGETPDGVALPGADPQHKDLYVQVNYGTTARELTATEREELRRIWADMPVDNPDGTQGVRLHLDEAPRGDDLQVVAQVADRRSATTKYYTREYVGDRRCVYHQVTFGQVATGNTTLVAATPGYGVVVDSTTRTGFDGNASWRSYAVTHGLLHNVVGVRANGRVHTSGGWLDTPLGPEDDRLPEVAATTLSDRGFADAAYYRENVC